MIVIDIEYDKKKKEGYNVTFVTSDFNHYAKQVRNIDKFYNEYPEYKNIKFVHVVSAGLQQPFEPADIFLDSFY